MAEDNTLGAPTEGLGQTVTFAAEGSRGVPQMQPVQREVMRVGQQGAGAMRTSQALQIPQATPNPTMQLLSKLGGEVLRPRIEAARTASYMQGMQKAAQGEAINEIVDEQPWYSKLFGSTSLVDGARAYSASAKATAVAVSMEEKMGELAKLSPEEFAKYSTDQLIGAQTGDSITDAMITQQIATTLPAVMKGQAKAHLRYQQNQLMTTTGDNMTAAFSLLGVNDTQARKPDATKEAADVLGASVKVIDALRIPDGVDPTTFDTLLGERAVQAISNGNFAVYTHLESSKRLDRLPPQVQASIRRAKAIATAEAHVNLPPEFSSQQAEWQMLATTPGTREADIAAGAARLNAEYTRLTGDTTPFAGAAATTREFMQLRQVQAQEHERLARELGRARTGAEKAQLEQELVLNLTKAVTSQQGFYMGDQAPETQQKVFDTLRANDARTGGTSLYNVLAKSSMHNRTDETTKTLIEGGVQHALSVGSSEMLYQTYKEYAKFVAASGDNGQTIAGKYAGEGRDILGRYHALAQGNTNMNATQIEALYYHAKQVPPKSASKEITKKVKAQITSWFGGEKTNDPDGLAAVLAPVVSEALPIKDAVRLAKQQVPGLTLVGGYHWQRGTQQTDLSQWLVSTKSVVENQRLGDDEFDDATELTVNAIAEREQLSGKISIIQGANAPDGTPQMFVSGLDVNNNVTYRLFSGKDIVNNWIAKKRPFNAATVPTYDPRNLGESELEKALKAKKAKQP